MDRPEKFCAKCKVALVYLLEAPAQNLDNVLDVVLTGSYGEFHDDLGFMVEPWDQSGHLRLHLCHDCGHELCDWLELDVDGWHPCDRDKG
jgi:hypothetical protein